MDFGLRENLRIDAMLTAFADGTPVTGTITDADAVLSTYSGKLPYKVRTNTTNGHRMVNDAATLERYNNGLLTTGCDG